MKKTMFVMLLLVVSIGVNMHMNNTDTAIAWNINNEMGTLPIFPPIG